MAKMVGDKAFCEKCGTTELDACPRCQSFAERGERYCHSCDWCEACGRSGSRPLPKDKS